MYFKTVLFTYYLKLFKKSSRAYHLVSGCTNGAENHSCEVGSFFIYSCLELYERHWWENWSSNNYWKTVHTTTEIITPRCEQDGVAYASSHCSLRPVSKIEETDIKTVRFMVACICHLIFSATTHYFFKRHCVVRHVRNTIFFEKNNVLWQVWTWATTQYLLKK